MLKSYQQLIRHRDNQTLFTEVELSLLAAPGTVPFLVSQLFPCPFLEISHSAKVPTVVGIIDFARLTRHQGPEAALLPSTLAQAHRGIVLVDAINRLVDTNLEIAAFCDSVGGVKSR